MTVRLTASDNSQRAWVLFGESGQEDVGKVDKQSTDGLFGRVIKPEIERISILNFKSPLRLLCLI